jgi:RNA polymerase sigma-70 factor (ECF subfamily)
MGKSSGRKRLHQLEEVIIAYGDRIYRFACYRIGSFADAQDIVQDVFIKLYNSSEKLENIENLSSYVYRSVSNACTDYLRKNHQMRFESIDHAIISESHLQNDASHQILIKEEYHRLESFLSVLPPEQAETIRLRIFDDLSFKEIAEITETAISTVKSRFEYGIEKLRNKIVRKEDYYGL